MTFDDKIKFIRDLFCISNAAGALLIYFDRCKLVLPVVLLCSLLPILGLFIPIGKKSHKKIFIAALVALCALSILIPVRVAVSTALVINLALLIFASGQRLCSQQKLDRRAIILSSLAGAAATLLLAVVICKFNRINVYSDMHVFVIAFAALFISAATEKFAPAKGVKI